MGLELPSLLLSHVRNGKAFLAVHIVRPAGLALEQDRPHPDGQAGIIEIRAALGTITLYNDQTE